MDEEVTFGELLLQRQRKGKQSGSRNLQHPSQAQQEEAAPETAARKRQRSPADDEEPRTAKRSRFHRENKNRPTEVTAKRPVGRHKDVLHAGTGYAGECLEHLCTKQDVECAHAQVHT